MAPTDNRDYTSALRMLPSVERLSRHPVLAALESTLRVESARFAIAAARDAIRVTDLPVEAPDDDTLAARAWA